jgi:PPOX class probable FMN-dependent enzyme
MSTNRADGEVRFEDVVDAEGLRALYRRPTRLVAEKKVDRIEPWARAVIGASRFVFVATADGEGRATVSPKGGSDGFVAVLDERRLAIPDYPGNNLIDSLRNIIDNPSIGLIFLIPGRDETLRVDGDACVTTNRDVLEQCRRGDRRRPKAAIGVRVMSMFFHCPSSFQRAGLWDRAGWRADAALPYGDFIRASLPEEEWPSWA